MTIHYMAQVPLPVVKTGLADMPLLIILAGVLLCAGIAAVTLALLRRTRPVRQAATTGLSPGRIVFKIVMLLLVLAAAAFYMLTEYGIGGAKAGGKGEPCCPQAEEQPCCDQGGDQLCCPQHPSSSGAEQDESTNSGIDGVKPELPGEDKDK